MPVGWVCAWRERAGVGVGVRARVRVRSEVSAWQMGGRLGLTLCPCNAILGFGWSLHI